MHRGVQELIAWLEASSQRSEVDMGPPATGAQITRLEQQIGAPLPADLRLVLGRFNGGITPSGRILSVSAGEDPPEAGTIEAAMHDMAKRLSRAWSDPELLLPFFESDDGGLLAFDRSAAPLSDAWPVVDYYAETGDLKLVYRTFDGWCRHRVAEWSADDFDAPFDVEKYLRQGQRHAAVEQDVSTAHATVAHAHRRAGQPVLALQAYLRAARCVPALPWCDWEALKLAVLLRDEKSALDAASRLCSRATPELWIQRETTTARIAAVIGAAAGFLQSNDHWLRLLDQLDEQAEDAPSREYVRAVRRAMFAGETPPPLATGEEGQVPPLAGDADADWQALCQSYLDGALRDEQLLLNPRLEEWRAKGNLSDILCLRRDF